jgi:hypothetical protein
MYNFDQIYTLVITLIIVPLVTWIITKAVALLDAKIAFIKSEKLQMAVKNAKSEVEKAVYLAVSEVQQTFVEALKADGNFTSQDAKIAFYKSMERAKEIVSATAMAVLVQATIDINSLITAEIEANLATIKYDRQTVVTTTTTPETTVVSSVTSSIPISGGNV